MKGRGKRAGRVLALAAVTAVLYAPVSQAVRFDYDFLGGIEGTLNSSISLGAQWRLSDRNPNIIGVSNLNPTACRSFCQPHASTEYNLGNPDVPGRVQLGLEGEGDFVNQLGLDAPGAGSINHDDGTLNFDQWEMTQAVAQINQDLTVNFRKDFGFINDLKFFVRYNAFHDFVNYNREQYYPNYYTPEDRARDDARRNSGEYGFPTVGSEVMRDTGDKYNEYVGQDIDILDAYVQAYLPTAGLFGTNIGDLQVTIGEQTINWGESTLFVRNSINSVNPPNVNALYRPAFLDLATVFEPIGAIKVSAPLTLNTSFTAFYQYDWEPVEIPPRGSFLSTIDLTLGANDNNINPGFGQGPDDPEGNMRAEQELLTAVADISGQVPINEEPASQGGQYGFAFTWFMPEFNNGTEFRFYYLNYHSRFPFASAHAGQESCLQSTPSGETLTDLVSLAGDCPNADFGHFLGAVGQDIGGQLGGQIGTVLGQTINGLNLDQLPTARQPNGEDPCPAGAAPGSGPCAELYRLDSFDLLLEYPEDIHLYGISFNTSFGALSMQGEIAYRPNLPLQVDDIDLAFAALQPSAPVGCADGAYSQNQDGGCQPGTFDDRYTIGLPLLGDLADTVANSGELLGAIENLLGVDSNLGNAVQTLLDGLAARGLDLEDINNAFPNLPDELLLTDPPGRRNAFPDYLTEYRGRSPGSVRPGEYIRGYERFQVLQYNLGFTYVMGPGNWLQSDQVILFFELGATHVPGLPELDELQIEGPGTFYHRSVGTDGSGAPECPADEAPQGTSPTESGNTRLCGPYQGRFNPTQQREGYATQFSWGYNVIGIIRYENVFPGISFEPTIIWQQDMDGISPGPGGNFVEGRNQFTANVAMRVGQNWSYIVGATFFFGNEKRNYLADRDFFQVGLEYRF